MPSDSLPKDDGLGSEAVNRVPPVVDRPFAGDDPSKPVLAILVDKPAESLPTTPPQPGLLFAVLLAILPVSGQAATSIAVVLAASVLVAARNGAVDVEQVAASVNGFLLPLATLSNLIIALAVVAVFFGRHSARRIAWRNCSMAQWTATLLLVLPLAILASEVSNCATEALSLVEPSWLEHFRDSNSQLFEDFARQSWLLVFVGACLLPGVGEEIYCRGLISRGLIARYGVCAGTVFASLLFGAMHLEPIQASSAFALGLVLQYLFLVTRSLPAAVALHMLNNLAAFVVMRIEDRLYIPGLSLPPGGHIVHIPPLLLGCSAVAAAAVGVALYQMRTKWRLPGGEFWSPGYVTAESPPAETGAQAITATPHAGIVLVTIAVYAAFLVCLFAFSQTNLS